MAGVLESLVRLLSWPARKAGLLLYDILSPQLLRLGIWIFEANMMPDWLSRIGMRQMIATNLIPRNIEDQRVAFNEYIERLKKCPTIAVNTADANEQHYELPPEFFYPIMGKHLKYSCCHFPDDLNIDDIDTAEEYALNQVCTRAALKDGLNILELGCGWGSLSLWMAKKYPNSKIYSVSNSKDQREVIMARAKQMGITNLEVQTCDINVFKPPEGRTFDQIMSIEMFEHMKNYQTLFSRCTEWLKPGGKMFIHIFCHKLLAYDFETDGDINWMGKYFFTGGTMPADHLFLYFCHPLKIVGHWAVNGVHYSKTLEVWMRRMDKNMKTINPILDKVYGRKNRTLWTARWRGFFLACSELFAYNGGNEWYVSHYLFEKPK